MAKIEKTCYISVWGGLSERALALLQEKKETDLFLATDGGYRAAHSAGFTPDLVLGDFDSLEEEALCEEQKRERFPVEKDDTDSMLAVKYAIEKSCQRIYLFGAIGGRIDHSLANFHILQYCHKRGVTCEIIDESCEARMLEKESIILPYRDGWIFSIFPWGERCEGIYESGVKYPLENATITNEFPLGISNEITEEEAVIHVENGTLLLIQIKLQGEEKQ